MAAIELVVRVIKRLQLMLGKDARIAPPYVRRTPHLEAMAERHVGGAVDRHAPLLVHHDAVVVVVEKEVLRLIDERRGIGRERLAELRKADSFGAIAEECGFIALALLVFVVERGISRRRLFLPCSFDKDATAVPAEAFGRSTRADCERDNGAIRADLKLQLERDGNNTVLGHGGLPGRCWL